MMKTKKNNLLKTIIYLFVFVGALALTAQDKDILSIPLSQPNEHGKLVVHIIDGTIEVTGYDGDEVIVTAKGRGKGIKSKERYNRNKKDGLKRVENRGLKYTIEEINNTVYIKSTSGEIVIDFEIEVPRHFSVDLKTINKGSIIVDGVNGTHEASNTNGEITMTDVGGSVVADALNKDLTVEFKTITENTTMMFSSLNGDIDITFPSNLKANVIARSDFGNVYTDFEIKVDKTKQSINTSKGSKLYRVTNGKGVSGLINGGGADITFKTLNGDILIRSN